MRLTLCLPGSPFSPVVTTRDGRAIPVEDLAGEFAEAFVLHFAEADDEAFGHRAVLWELVEVLVEEFLEDGDRVLVHVAVVEVEHGLDGGDDAVAAGFAEQRGVISVGLVVVAAGEVDDLRAGAGEQLGLQDIVARRHHAEWRAEGGEVPQVVGDQDPVIVHGESRFSKRRAGAPSS